MQADFELNAGKDRIVVVGLGNPLLRDDGAGVHLVRDLASRYLCPANVIFIDGGTSAMALLDIMGDAELLIIVDAVHIDEPAGTLVQVSQEQLLGGFRRQFFAHHSGISGALCALELLGRSPKQVRLFGIQAESLAVGMELTPAVHGRLPELRRLVLAQLRERKVQLRLRNAHEPGPAQGSFFAGQSPSAGRIPSGG
jgi:hydrogenase maturation protease